TSMITVLQILLYVLDVFRFFVIVNLIMSWLIRFEVLNVRQELVGQIWYGLERLLAPVYDRVRRFMPNLGGIDITPIAVLVAIEIVRIILRNAMISIG
ncbi:MAG: YggT family protein, partial [Pseudomonadota bacterium]